jgi:xanthine dehydrogenase accessory factor
VAVVAEEFDGEDFGDASLWPGKDFSLNEIKLNPQSFIVVSTQGESDEEALEQAINSDAAYVAFVASRTKAEKVAQFLRSKGLPQEKLSRLRAPAGLNLGAGTPEEIAVSVLAEIVQVRAANSKPAAKKKAAAVLPVINTETKDPICGMMVDMSKAKHKSEYQSRWFYFCCAGCKQKFEAEPARYAS